MTSLERFSLRGKRAIVTGASRGIGRAIALGFAEAGADVALVSRKLEALRTVAKEIEEHTAQRALPIACHMGRADDVNRMVEEVLREWGAVDILVNNAGTNPVMGPLADMDPAAWDKIMDINLKGPYLASARVIRAMIERGDGGKIINISSAASLEPAPMLGAYSVSKAALNHLTRTLAKECGHARICVNAIAPGLIETQFAAALINNPAIHQSVVRGTPLGRHGQPDEIVGAALLLASGASDFMTGQIVVVDGGARM
ncbi:MAG TPA: SDR family oxidoreductase [Candidatus Binatia bacterium]|jgi:NAD(P)-dependent dehydrogenase (short-subunit alcohol dehydrogenase family)